MPTGKVVWNKTVSQERGEHFLLLPRSGQKSPVFDVFRASGRVSNYPRPASNYPRPARTRPLGGGRGRDKSLPKGIGIVREKDL